MSVEQWLWALTAGSFALAVIMLWGFNLTADMVRGILNIINERDEDEVMSEELDKVVLEKGTLIHYRGMPFRLPDDVIVLGRQENKDLADGPSRVCRSSGD